MSIRVALNHKTYYTYDRHIAMGPQIIRLRPAPHCRTPILSYSMKVRPEQHFLNWQQDPHGNYLARVVFPEKADRLQVEVDLVAEMTVQNPFDFFVEESAEHFPFRYEDWLKRELRPFLETSEPGPRLRQRLDQVDRSRQHVVNFLVDLNQSLQREIRYLVRLEPGVQTPDETLAKASGSCRDSAWLLVQLLRHLGLAARFVSGYLIQLVADVEPLDGPAGPAADFTDLHAWAEVYLPGAGWVGLDPTSGLLAGEGHLPVACTPDPQSAAPITGSLDPCEVNFSFEMNVTRLHEDPRVTKPYTEAQWQRVLELGSEIDRRLQQDDVRLTMGGEPTFVSVDDMDGAEWNVAAVGADKRRLSEQLIKRLRDRFAPQGLLHFGQGKWYPGESLPRWALGCYWRSDGQPIWTKPDLVADETRDYGFGLEQAERFARHLAHVLGVTTPWIAPVYEDALHYLRKEQQLPVNVDPQDPKLEDPEERARMIEVFQRGLGQPVGYVMPLARQWWQSQARWRSGPWSFRADKLFLLPGDSPVGLRLPLESLPWLPEDRRPLLYPPDPLVPQPPLPEHARFRQQPFLQGEPEPASLQGISEQRLPPTGRGKTDGLPSDAEPGSEPIRTALCVEPRQGRLYVFMPPTERLEDYLELVAAIEQTAEELELPVLLEGYLPPQDARLNQIKVTPDPGVIEVNIHPAHNWAELVENTISLYEEARLTRLGTEKFDLDGKHTGTGGGNHVVLGGDTPADSPFLRRPDLIRSLVGYWNNHPSLSYLFSSRFVGPTSQAPRLDEGRRDALYEMELAFDLVPGPDQRCPPWLVDRIFRHLLVDLTGNTHRAEFCIDKLYSPDSASGRLGLLEMRAFEMPPHAHMSLTQQLLIRGLISRFWRQPYVDQLVEWGTSLHDRFLLPHFTWHDFREVVNDLRRAGLEFVADWFLPHFEFRFPIIGEFSQQDVSVQLRSAIEPWYVLGEEPGTSGTVRYVDSSDRKSVV